MATTDLKLTLKLLVNKKANKVMFAEANKDFVDFLFSLMGVPVGTVISLLSTQNMAGCLGDLYESIENLSETYMLPKQRKDCILTTNYRMTTEMVVLGKTNAAASTSSNNGGGGGFVKEVVTYMVMDNLAVMPMSTISSITMLNKFQVHDVSALEEKLVDLGREEGLKLLEAAFKSKTVLTDVFLPKELKCSEVK